MNNPITETKIEPEYLTSEELAKLLNISKKSVFRWVQNGRIPGAIKIGHLWRFRRLHVERALISGNFLRKH